MSQDTKRIDLFYPRADGNPSYVEVDLVSVRAADGIRISYDYERDGWVIEQASRFAWAHEEVGPDGEVDEDWQEVAFVQAWQRESCENPTTEDGECGALCPQCTGATP